MVMSGNFLPTPNQYLAYHSQVPSVFGNIANMWQPGTQSQDTSTPATTPDLSGGFGSVNPALQAGVDKDKALEQIAMYRAMGRMYKPSLQLNTQPVTSVGAGIGEALGNIANMMYRGQQQRQQDQYWGGLQNQIIGAQQQQAQQEQAQIQAANQARYQTLINSGIPANQAAVMLMYPKSDAMVTPYVTHAAIGPNEAAKEQGSVTGTANGKLAVLQNLDKQGVNLSPVDQNGNPMAPSAQDVNTYHVLTGVDPQTNLTMSQQVQALRGLSLKNDTDAYNLGVLPTKTTQQITGTNLENQGKYYDNFIKNVQANFAQEMAQAKADAAKTDVASKENNYNNELKAQAILQQASQPGGALYDPTKWGALQTQLESLGSKVNLASTWKGITNAPPGQKLNISNYTPGVGASTLPTFTPPTMPIKHPSQQTPVRLAPPAPSPHTLPVSLPATNNTSPPGLVVLKPSVSNVPGIGLNTVSMPSPTNNVVTLPTPANFNPNAKLWGY